jgi:hypothetical protein
MIYNSLGILLNREEIWLKRLEDVKSYIDTNNKKPSRPDKNKEINSLGNWIGDQQKHYKTKKCIMSNVKIYTICTEFINSDKYKIYFLSNEENWKLKLYEVKNYIDTNNNIPLNSDKDNQINILGKWIQHQKTNYKNKEDIMKNEEIYKIWTEFINSHNYKSYFISNNGMQKILNYTKNNIEYSFDKLFYNMYNNIKDLNIYLGKN